MIDLASAMKQHILFRVCHPDGLDVPVAPIDVKARVVDGAIRWLADSHPSIVEDGGADLLRAGLMSEDVVAVPNAANVSRSRDLSLDTCIFAAAGDCCFHRIGHSIYMFNRHNRVVSTVVGDPATPYIGEEVDRACTIVLDGSVPAEIIARAADGGLFSRYALVLRLTREWQTERNPAFRDMLSCLGQMHTHFIVERPFEEDPTPSILRTCWVDPDLSLLEEQRQHGRLREPIFPLHPERCRETLQKAIAVAPRFQVVRITTKAMWPKTQWASLASIVDGIADQEPGRIVLSPAFFDGAQHLPSVLASKGHLVFDDHCTRRYGCWEP